MKRLHLAGLFGLFVVACNLARADPVLPALKIVSLLETGQPVKIICFGDSVTGVYYHTGNRRAWCDLVGLALQRLYPRARIEMINAGVSGNSSTDGLRRMDADVLRHQPQLVIAMFGLNDVVRVSPEDFRADLRTIVRRSRDARAEVILLTPNLVSDGDPARTLAKVAAYAQITREVGREMDVPVTDTFSAFQSIQSRDRRTWLRLMSDEIHPNLRGHRVLAQEVVRTLTGRDVSLDDLPRLRPGLPRVLARLQAHQIVRVIAMKPYDTLIASALHQLYPASQVDVTPWDVAGLSLAEIEIQAKGQGWPKYRAHPDLAEPDLIVLAVPAEAKAPDEERFFHSYTWVMNWSLGFTPPGWNCLVILPSVAEPPQSPAQRTAESLAVDVIQGQDLPWIRRSPGDQRSAAELLRAQLAQLLEVPKS